MFSTPFTRKKPGASRFRDSRTLSSVGKSAHTARPNLESLEARLLLSADAGFAIQYPVPTNYYAYTRLLLPSSASIDIGGDHGWDASGNPIDFAPIDDPSSRGATYDDRTGKPAMMSVYDETDASNLYQMKTLNLAVSDKVTPAVGSSTRPSIFSTPPQPAIKVIGSIDPPPDSAASFRIPVGPEVGGLRLGVSASNHQPSSNIPFFDDLTLYDADGRKIAEMNAHWDVEHLPSPSLLVSLANVPAGSQLVLRISALAAAAMQQSLGNDQSFLGANSSPSDPSFSTFYASTSFVLTVEEFMNLSTPNGLVSNGSMSGGEQSRLLLTASSDDADDIDGLYALSNDRQSNLGFRGTLAGLGSDDSAPESRINVRIPTGPLIARGAAPMGGILATAVTEEDPAPGLERFDGLLTAFLNGWTGDEDQVPDLESSEAEDERVVIPGAPGQPTNNIIIAGTTPGNLPLVSSSVTMRTLDADESAAFLASLPSFDVVEPAPVPIVSPLEIGLMAEPRSSTELGARVGSWASAAFGLTIGLSLTSSTYFPDILGRLRKLSQRKPVRQKTRRKLDRP